MNSSCQILSTYFNAKKYRENTWTYQKTENQWKSCPSGSSNIFQYISSKHRIPIAMVIFCLPIHQALPNSDGAVGSPGGWEGWCSIGKWFEFSKDCQDSWNLSSAGFEFLDHFFSQPVSQLHWTCFPNLCSLATKNASSRVPLWWLCGARAKANALRKYGVQMSVLSLCYWLTLSLWNFEIELESILSKSHYDSLCNVVGHPEAHCLLQETQCVG